MLLRIMTNKSMIEMHRVAVELFKSEPKEKLNTMTFDNSKKFAGHLAI
jgi:IS30 family transposase